jgi:hypothetical protein
VSAEIPEEMNGAALPRRTEDLRQSGLQARVRVTDRELHPAEAPGDQRPQELAPKRLRFRLADVEADDLAAPRLVHRVRDNDALPRDPAAVPDLLDLRVDEQIRVAALPRPLPKRLDLLVEEPSDPVTLLFEIRNPRLSTSWSTRLVETPHTYACCTTLTSACSERFRGCKNDGK